MKKRKTAIPKTQFPLMLSIEERENVEILRDNSINVSAYLRLCLKRKAAEFDKEAGCLPN